MEQEQLSTVIDLLQARLKPEAIYLFGSQASGQASSGKGDVDLFVIVGDDKNPYHETVDAYESLQEMPFPKDIIVRCKSRFEQRATWPFTLESEVLRTGRMVYSHE